MKSFYLYLSLVLLLIHSEVVGAQVSNIRGDVSKKNINVYAKVSEIGLNYAVLADGSPSSSYESGDTVLLVQMNGAACIKYQDPQNSVESLYGAGKYEFLIVGSVSGNKIQFRKNLLYQTSGVPDYSASQALQLIRVKSFAKAAVDSTLTCPGWDKTSETGGILVLIVGDTLELNANIDVTAKGFKGGKETTFINQSEYSTDGYYLASEATKGALKGDGITSFISSTPNEYVRGFQALINAGGGGNCRGASGGGGGLFGQGIDGGGQYSGKTDYACDANDLSGNGGGIPNQRYFYPITSSDPDVIIRDRDRIFMGGGGGAGAGSESDANPLPTNGADGGGILFVIANHIKANNYSLIANGGSVTDVAKNYSGGGGGGGGGYILLTASSVDGNLNVKANGGNGGAISHCPYCSDIWGTWKYFGGGGGGGGFVWYSSNIPSANLTSYTVRGLNGATTCEDQLDQGTGGEGAFQSGFSPIFNVFFFNQISGSNTICYNTTPSEIKGSQPIGCGATPTIQWEQRTVNSTVWQTIPGATDIHYQPATLTVTTYYRRLVLSSKLYDSGGAILIDTSNFVAINVHPEIIDNVIYSPDPDSICFGLAKIKIRNRLVAHVNGPADYNLVYKWEYSEPGQNSFSLIANELDSSHFASNEKSYDYRRKVYYSFCYTNSNVVNLTVLQTINGNTISSDTTICSGASLKTLKSASGSIITGGNESKPYSYKWIYTYATPSDSTNYIETLVTTPTYDPGTAVTTTIYRRIVLSGKNNTCVDTSAKLRIKVWPLITGNSFVSEDTIICQKTSSNKFRMNQLGGGDGLNYRSIWYSKTEQTAWQEVADDKTALAYRSGILDVTTYFKRKISSGLADCCVSTSASITVEVKPKLEHNLIAGSGEICSGQTPLSLTNNGVISGGGDSYHLIWQRKDRSSGGWQDIDNAIDNDYSPASLTDTTYYRRRAYTTWCKDTSNVLTISVLKLISGNTISGAEEVCDKMQPTSITGGELSGGKPGNFSYRWDSVCGGSWTAISGAVSPNYQPSVLALNTQFRRVVFSGANNCCQSISNAFLIKINSLPVAKIDTQDTAICTGAEGQMKLRISAGTSPFDVEVSDGSNVQKFTGLSYGSNILNIKPAQTLSYSIYSVIDSKGCVADAQSKVGTQRIRLIEVPVAVVDSGKEVCGLITKLKATKSVGSGKWTGTTGAVYSPSEIDPNADVTVSTYGGHRFLWTETNETCSDTASVYVVFDELPTNVDAGTDSKEEFVFSLQLNAPLPNIGAGVWSSRNTKIVFDNVADPKTKVSNLSIGKNVFLWTVTNGVCNAVTDSVIIDIADVKRYTVFTPNNDGKNDYFVVDGAQNATIKELKVFDRLGSLVYSSDNYLNNWDGTDKGKQLPEDTYFYIFNADGRLYKGFFVIRR